MAPTTSPLRSPKRRHQKCWRGREAAGSRLPGAGLQFGAPHPTPAQEQGREDCPEGDSLGFVQGFFLLMGGGNALSTGACAYGCVYTCACACVFVCMQRHSPTQPGRHTRHYSHAPHPNQPGRRTRHHAHGHSQKTKPVIAATRGEQA